jgi:F-box interacting protein
LIRKYKKLPTEPIQSPSGFSEYQVPQLAFGHDPVNDDYKVLRVVQFFKSGEFPSAFEMKAYSLKADSWRRVEGKWPYKESYIPTNLESLSSASLNGVVH